MPTCVDCNGYYDSIAAADAHECRPTIEQRIAKMKAASHYAFLDRNFDTVLDRMGRSDLIEYRGNFSASGDKYSQYRHIWEKENISYFHGAVMYHLMELLYYKEVRETRKGWVDPYQWVIDNYRGGHNLSQYMEGLV